MAATTRRRSLLFETDAGSIPAAATALRLAEVRVTNESLARKRNPTNSHSAVKAPSGLVLHLAADRP
jgi:hypothetical protein